MNCDIDCLFITCLKTIFMLVTLEVMNLVLLDIQHYSGEGNGNTLKYSCLDNPMDGGAWQAAVYGVSESWSIKKLNAKEFMLLNCGVGEDF